MSTTLTVYPTDIGLGTLAGLEKHKLVPTDATIERVELDAWMTTYQHKSKTSPDDLLKMTTSARTNKPVRAVGVYKGWRPDSAQKNERELYKAGQRRALYKFAPRVTGNYATRSAYRGSTPLSRTIYGIFREHGIGENEPLACDIINYAEWCDIDIETAAHKCARMYKEALEDTRPEIMIEHVEAHEEARMSTTTTPNGKHHDTPAPAAPAIDKTNTNSTELLYVLAWAKRYYDGKYTLKKGGNLWIDAPQSDARLAARGFRWANKRQAWWIATT